MQICTKEIKKPLVGTSLSSNKIMTKFNSPNSLSQNLVCSHYQFYSAMTILLLTPNSNQRCEKKDGLILC